MKRFVLPALISTIYLTVMIGVFSTDYSQEKGFLFPTKSAESASDAMQEASHPYPVAPQALKTTGNDNIEASDSASQASSSETFDAHSPEASE